LVENSNISQNSIGFFADDCSSVILRNTTAYSNSTWGVLITGGGPGDQTTLDNCVVRDNVGGLSVANAGSGDLQLINGTELRDNSGSGLHLESCNLSLNNQVGTTWRSLRNGYGLSCNATTLTLTNTLVESSTAYGLHCTSSTVQTSNCLVSAPWGLYADQNASLTLDASRFNSTGSGGCDWGVHCTNGNMTMRNCVVSGFTNGVYYTTSLSTDAARILNCTVAQAGHYGVYLTGSDVVLQNSIVTGATNAQYGLVQGGDHLVHSHNLFHGFQTTYTGATQDSTELIKEPHFVNEAYGDLHLAVGSPAINSGADLSAQITTDADGNTRPSYRAYEMGAYEFTQSHGSLRVLSWSEQR
jgi:hypothetical protein